MTDATREKIFEYIIKEIETNTQNLSSFRSKTNFNVYVGPFILLGAIIVSKQEALLTSFQKNLSSIPFWMPFMLIVFYWFLGFICSQIERHIWARNEKLRNLIVKLQDNKFELSFEDLEFKAHIRASYIAVYGVMILIFVLILFILLKLSASG